MECRRFHPNLEDSSKDLRSLARTTIKDTTLTHTLYISPLPVEETLSKLICITL